MAAAAPSWAHTRHLLRHDAAHRVVGALGGLQHSHGSPSPSPSGAQLQPASVAIEGIRTHARHRASTMVGRGGAARAHWHVMRPSACSSSREHPPLSQAALHMHHTEGPLVLSSAWCACCLVCAQPLPPPCSCSCPQHERLPPPCGPAWFGHSTRAAYIRPGGGGRIRSNWIRSCCLPPCRAVPCRVVPCRVISCRAVPWRGVACSTVAWRAVPCHIVPYRGVPRRGVPWRVVQLQRRVHDGAVLV